jgi:hypothetical protein
MLEEVIPEDVAIAAEPQVQTEAVPVVELTFDEKLAQYSNHAANGYNE